MAPGFWQILLVVLIAFLLFGRGRISEMMGDLGRGIQSFKKGLSDGSVASEAPLLSKVEKQESPETDIKRQEDNV